MADGTKQEETPAPAEGAQKQGESSIVLFLVRHARGVHNYAAGLHGVEAYKKWEYEDARWVRAPPRGWCTRDALLRGQIG